MHCLKILDTLQQAQSQHIGGLGERGKKFSRGAVDLGVKDQTHLAEKEGRGLADSPEEQAVRKAWDERRTEAGEKGPDNEVLEGDLPRKF